jgi:hypothetical protein
VSKLRPLLASYGGGHTAIIAKLATALCQRGDDAEVIGFTTAYREFRRQGIAAHSVVRLIDPTEDAYWLSLAQKYVGESHHRDIMREEALAYFAIGIRDLAEEIGEEPALEKFRTDGRRAFEPIRVMRRYLQRTRPDIVITTTSPRAELALLKAARIESIPSLAVGDLFLLKESQWILHPDYAENLAVLSSEVASRLISEGFPSDSVRVTGNPAFDDLVRSPYHDARRAEVRSKLGVEGKTVVLFCSPGSEVSMIGRPFLDIGDVVTELESLCQELDDHCFILRTHPNWPFKLPAAIRNGTLDNGNWMSATDALLAADVVWTETSTMGLQAALLERRVICIGFSDYVIYPSFGLASAASSLKEASKITRVTKGNADIEFGMPALGTATSNVLAYIDDIVSKASRGKQNDYIR